MVDSFMKYTSIVRHILIIEVYFFIAEFFSQDNIKVVRRYLDGAKGGGLITLFIGVDASELHYMNEQGTSIRETAVFFNIPSCETLQK